MWLILKQKIHKTCRDKISHFTPETHHLQEESLEFQVIECPGHGMSGQSGVQRQSAEIRSQK